MNILSLFGGFNNFKDVALSQGHICISLDIKNYKNCTAHDIITDFLTWDYNSYDTGQFDFILVGFPCTTFSKASRWHHYKNDKPVTVESKKALLMIDKLKEVLNYFNADWIIENPTSALISNKYFQSKFDVKKLNLIRVHQYLYGHDTFKQTDLLTNCNLLWLDNSIYRVNGKRIAAHFDNLTLKQRQSYPVHFCEKILNYMQYCNSIIN
jgi:hypothetical protein